MNQTNNNEGKHNFVILVYGGHLGFKKVIVRNCKSSHPPQPHQNK